MVGRSVLQSSCCVDNVLKVMMIYSRSKSLDARVLRERERERERGGGEREREGEREGEGRDSEREESGREREREMYKDRYREPLEGLRSRVV